MRTCARNAGGQTNRHTNAYTSYPAHVLAHAHAHTHTLSLFLFVLRFLSMAVLTLPTQATSNILGSKLTPE